MKQQIRPIVVLLFFVHLNISCGEKTPRNPTPEIIEQVKMGNAGLADKIMTINDRRVVEAMVKKFEGSRHLETRLLMQAIGMALVGTPYRANTLESNDGSEQLIINLHEFDCVTFVESTMALAKYIKSGSTDFADYAKYLKLIRYRGGELKSYDSRLHYFTDWIFDNEQKQLVENVSKIMENTTVRRKIDFMTTHRSAYPALANDTVFRHMQWTEAAISQRDISYVPKAMVESTATQILDGDIILITTDINGLDAVHTGLAMRVNNRLHLLHASPGKGVIVSDLPLSEYLAQNKKQNGIIVARAMD